MTMQVIEPDGCGRSRRIRSISGGSTNLITDLDAGLFAIVRAVRQNNVLVARSIDIRATLDDDSDNLLG
jgi:hypothetical protein